jgi:hypothetical protein
MRTPRNLMLLVLSPLTAVTFLTLVANPAAGPSTTATVAAANSGPWE